jgi:hypothetical protein
MKKNLFVVSHSIWPLLGNEIDLIKQKIDKNILVKVLFCNGEPNYCSANSYKFKNFNKITHVCTYCKSRFHDGIEWLGAKNLIVDKHYYLKDENKEKIKHILKHIYLKIKYENQLNKYLSKIDKYLYLSIKSTLSSQFQNHEVRIFKNKDLLIKCCEDALISYYSSINHYKKFLPDEIFIFNGRTTRYQPFLRNFKKYYNKKVYVYEHPEINHSGLDITKGNLPHDPKTVSNQILSISKKSRTSEKKLNKFAKEFVENNLKQKNKKNFIVTPWINKKKLNELPQDFNNKNYNIGIFLSSEYENLYTYEFLKLFAFRNQLDAVFEIVKKIKIHKKEAKTFIRLHPNSGLSADQYYNDLTNKFQSKKIEIIKYDSKIDSHALALQCNCVITFGSSMAVDLSFMGKKVLNIGPSRFMSFNIQKHFFSKSKFLKAFIKSLNKDDNNYKDLKDIKIMSSKFIYFSIKRKLKNKYYFSNSLRFGYLKKNNKKKYLLGNKKYLIIYYIFKVFGYFFPYFKSTMNRK